MTRKKRYTKPITFWLEEDLLRKFDECVEKSNDCDERSKLLRKLIRDYVDLHKE